jgi:hypothetical protein
MDEGGTIIFSINYAIKDSNSQDLSLDTMLVIGNEQVKLKLIVMAR